MILDFPAEDAPVPHVAVGRDEAVAIATIVNPSRRNAISIGMWRELEAFSVAVSADPSVRAVLIRGDGDVFCAGADISAFEAERADTTSAREYDDQLDLACRTLESIRQPTVALLRGPVVGAGATLAASCDLRIASDDVFFMVPAARLGLGFDPRAVARLARVFGDAATRWMLLTAGRLPVQRAFASGAVHEAYDGDELDEAAARLIARLVENAPLTLAAAKLALRAVAEGAEPTLMDEAWQLTELADGSDDYVEGRTAFAQKRAPNFDGR